MYGPTVPAADTNLTTLKIVLFYRRSVNNLSSITSSAIKSATTVSLQCFDRHRHLNVNTGNNKTNPRTWMTLPKHDVDSTILWATLIWLICVFAIHCGRFQTNQVNNITIQYIKVDTHYLWIERHIIIISTHNNFESTYNMTVLGW